MGKAKVLLTVLSSAHDLSRLMGSLTLSWLTLGWQVRKARKAFEAELTKEGMSNEDARRMSRYISDLKDQISLRSMVSYYREARKHERT